MSLTLIIIIGTVIASVVALQNQEVMARMQFNAYRVRHQNEHYRFFTYGLVHADWIHLAINMFVLYSFGKNLEQYFAFHFGNKASFYFLLLYIGGIVFSPLWAYRKHKDHEWYNAVGASGAVSALVFASILVYPTSRIGIIFIPVMIPAVLFGALYLVYSFYMERRAKDNIGHDAHIGGAIFGVLTMLILDPSLGKTFIWQIRSLL